MSSILKTQVRSGEYCVILFFLGYSKQMRLWISKNRSWKQLNPLQLLPVPLWSQLQQPKENWWHRERWVSRTSSNGGRSIKIESSLLTVLLEQQERSLGKTGENVVFSLLITIHGPGLVLLKKKYHTTIMFI